MMSECSVKAPPRIYGWASWGGDIELEGECVIEPSAILILEPGCRVKAVGGARAIIVAEGVLLAKGGPDRPVLLDVSIGSAGGRVSLSHCRLRGRGGEGLNLFGSNHRLDDVSLEGFDAGLLLRDGALSARNLTMSACGSAAVVGEGGILAWEGGGAASAGGARTRIVAKGELTGNGLTLDGELSLEGGRARMSRLERSGGDGTKLRLGELILAGCGAGVLSARGGRLDWAGQGGAAAVAVEGEFVARGEDGTGFALAATIATAGGRVELANCRLEGRGGEGLTLRGAGHRLENVTLAGFDCALSIWEGEARGTDLTVAGGRSVVVGEGGNLTWNGGGMTSAAGARARIVTKGELTGSALTLDATLSLEGGRARLSRVLLRGGDGTELAMDDLNVVGCGACAIETRGGSLIWEGARARDGSAAIAVEGELVARGREGAGFALAATIATAGGRVELANCRLAGKGGEGLTLSGPGHRLENVTLTGFRRGLSVWEGEVSASGLEVSGGERQIVGEGGRVRLARLLLRGDDGTALALDDLIVEGCGAWGLSARDGKFFWGGAGASDRFAAIAVEGELVARGAEGSAFALAATIVTAGGRVELANCRLEGEGGEGLTLRGAGHRLENVTLTGFQSGLSVWGGEMSALGLEVIGGARQIVGEGGRARLSRLVLRGDDGTRLALDELLVADCGAWGVSARGGRLIWGGAGARSSSAAIAVKGELVARGAAGGEFVLSATIAAAGGRMELANCRLEGKGGEALTLRGAGHRLENVTLAGFERGLSVRAGELRAAGLTIRGGVQSAAVERGGYFLWDGGGASGAGAGVRVRGGEAFLRDLRFAGLRRGVRVESGTARVEGLDCRELSGPAVELQGPGFASLRDCRAPGGVALLAAEGHVHLAGPFEGSVQVSPSAGLCVAPEAISREPLDARRGFILSTAGSPFFGRAYRAAAASSIRLFAVWARLQRGVAGAWVYRSWVAGGWEAGASDIDLALSVRELSSSGARTWLANAHALHARARRLFPALGELLIAEESEWSETAGSGLPRPREWARQARILAGRLPPVPEAKPEDARLGARFEAALAYTRLMHVCFRPRMAEELARREAAKAVVDLLRYRSPEGESGRAAPREEFRAAMSVAHPEWSERLRALAVPGGAHRAACALAAAAARHWDGGLRPETRASSSPALDRPLGSDGALRRRVEEIDGARRDFAGAATGAVFDTLHRSYLIVEPDCPESVLREGLAAWSRRAAVAGEEPPLPIVLTRPGWAAWRNTAISDFPASLAARPARDAPAAESAGRDFPGHVRLSWGRFLPPPPAPAEAAAALRQSEAQFRVIRRARAEEARFSRSAAHHLLVSAACLALARRGTAAPDFDLDAGLAALAPSAPRAADGLRRAAAGDWTGFEEAAAELLRPAAGATRSNGGRENA